MKAKDKVKVDTIRMMRARIQEGRDSRERAPGRIRAGSSPEQVWQTTARGLSTSLIQANRAEQQKQAEAELKIGRELSTQRPDGRRGRGHRHGCDCASGASSAKDMGAVMALVMPQVKGRCRRQEGQSDRQNVVGQAPLSHVPILDRQARNTSELAHIVGDESWCQFFGHDSLADYRGEVTAKVIPFRRPDSIKEWRRADGSTGQVAPIGRDVLDPTPLPP